MVCTRVCVAIKFLIAWFAHKTKKQKKVKNTQKTNKETIENQKKKMIV